MVDRTLNNSCFAVGVYGGGAILRIGNDMANGGGYLMYHNTNWKDVEVGKEFKLRMTFEDGSYFDGEFTAMKLGETVFLSIGTSRAFVLNFMKHHGMTITTRTGKVLDEIGLKGTAGAVAAILTCQEEINGAAPATKPAPRSNDPSA